VACPYLFVEPSVGSGEIVGSPAVRSPGFIGRHSFVSGGDSTVWKSALGSLLDDDNFIGGELVAALLFGEQSHVTSSLDEGEVERVGIEG